MDTVALHRGTVQVRSPEPPPGSLAPACSCRHTFIGSATTEVKGRWSLLVFLSIPSSTECGDAWGVPRRPFTTARDGL